MKSLFDEITLGKIEVQNRLVRSATFEYGADQEGRYGQKMYDIYENLAKGGVGLIITGMVGVDENARVTPFMVKTYDGTFTVELQKLTELVHRYGSKMVVQIAHCGVKVQKTDAGLPPVAASKLPDKDYRELSIKDIQLLIDSFVTAATRCKDAGADGIQIHASHGYLLSQFLSPVFNKRTDEYGGSIERRAKIVFDVYDAVRAAVGGHYPIWFKINSSDLEENGLTFEECQWVCERLADMGVDAIEVSGGISISPESAPARQVQGEQDEGYFYRQAGQIAEKCKTDIISVGGYRTPELLEKKLNEGEVKAISLCRPFICEPDLANRWQSGNLAKAQCISCSKCFSPGELSCKVFPQ
jgi:2,4-dienoyl-CoA reductase-like NADH-dependent reductase (Old Yellow Enzyme family)